MNRLTSKFAAVVVTLVVLVASVDRVRAAEGGFSLYIPGAAGDILAAFSPAPGLQVSNGVLGVFGNVDAAVLQGVVDLGVERQSLRVCDAS